MGDAWLLDDGTRLESFEEFAARNEPRLRAGLSASFGTELGREVTVDALTYGWQNWDRVGSMANPVGYLYAVGRSRAARLRRRRRHRLPPPSVDYRSPWVEPGLPDAMASLTDRQRTVVALHYGYEWSLREIADLAGLKKSSVQNHLRRGMKKLQRKLGVDDA